MNATDLGLARTQDDRFDSLEAARHRRDEVWIGAGCRYPVGTVWWLYETGAWPGGFVRSIDRMVSSDAALRVPVTGVERV